MAPASDSSGDLSFFQKFTFSWMTKSVRAGRQGTLDVNTLKLPTDLYSTTTNARFEQKWTEIAEKAKAKGKKPSLKKALLSSFGAEFFTAGFFKLCWSVFVIAGAFYFVRSLLSFVSNQAPYDSYLAGWLLTAGFFIDSWLLGLALQRMTYICMTTGLKVRGALIYAVCKKAFNMASINKDQASDVVSFVASDITKIYDGMQEFHYLWTAPFEAAAILGLLGFLVQENALPGLGVMVLVLSAQYFFGWRIIVNKLKNSKNTQARGGIIQEVLPAMKLVKYYAWERFFEKEINEIRKREMKNMFWIAANKTINIALVFATPPMAACAIFATYEFQTGRLAPTVAFTSLSMFNIMRFPLVVLPKALRAASEAIAALQRVEEFLMTEVDTKTVVRDSIPGIKLENAVFEYTSGGNFKLQVPKFEVNQGEIVAVVGRVGAGKSSIIQALLGNMKQLQGEMRVGGRVSYVPQNWWVQNQTIRDNIVFGEEFNESLYREVIHACALELDLQILAKGDQSLGGLRGVNLSGGQRQRVNLARATYFNGDLVLLDNALSAVDHHTAEHIFEHCLKGMFRDKAVMFITHQLNFLPQCNKVAIMNDGQCLYFGPWCEDAQRLLSNYLPASHLLHAAGGAEGPREGPKKKDDKPKRTTSALTLSPTNVAEKVEKKKDGNKLTLAQSLNVYIRNGTWTIFTFCLLVFFAAQTTRQISDWWVRQWTGDTQNLYASDPENASVTYVLIYGILVAIFLVSMFIRGALYYWWTLGSSNTMFKKMLHRCLYAPLGFFFSTPVGDLLVTFSKDQDVQDESLPDSIHYLGIYGLILLSTTILVSITIPFFAIFAGVLFLVSFVMLYLYLPAATVLKKVRNDTTGAVVTLTLETLEGLSVVQAFSKQAYFVTEAARRVDINSRAIFNAESLNLWLAFFCDFYGAVMVLGVCIFSVTSKDSLGASAVGLAFSNTIQMLVFYTWVIRYLADSISMLSSTEKISWLATQTPQEGTIKQVAGDGATDADHKDKVVAIQVTNTPDKSWPTAGDIVYDNVYMKYAPSAPWALKGVTFHVQPSEKVGVVGRTGSGKSTLLLALYRMFELGKGRIIIDGVDVATIALKQLRRGLSVIPQEPVMWSGSVRNNLDPFAEHNDQELWDAVRQSGIEDIVKATGGLDGHVDGSGGRAWSLGQQQLCCLARAALRKVPILCLDEATAAMDPHTEIVVQASIKRMFSQRTTLTIAHRLDTVIESDKVMVMDAGVLKEFSPPKTLLDDRESMFSKLVDRSGPQAAAALRQLAAEHFSRAGH